MKAVTDLPKQKDVAALLIREDMLSAKPWREKRRDFEQGLSYFPPFTICLLLILILTFCGELAMGAILDSAALVQTGTQQGSQFGQWVVWRLVRGTFLHANFYNLLINCTVLYTMGMTSEHAYGTKNTVIFYFIGGMCGSLLGIAIQDKISIGSLNGILGIFGGLITFFFRYKDGLGMRDYRIAIFLAVMAFTAVGLHSFVRSAATMLDAYSAISGLAGGAAAALFVQKKTTTHRHSGKKLLLALSAIFGVCLVIFSHFGYFYVLHGTGNFSFSRPEAAVGDATLALDIDAANLGAYYLRSRAYHELRKYTLERADLDVIIVVLPENTLVHVQRGHSLFSGGDTENAIAEFNRALALEPTSLEAYDARGYAYCRLSRYEEAAKDFEQAIRINPHYSSAYLHLGLIAAHQGDAAAVALFKRGGANDIVTTLAEDWERKDYNDAVLVLTKLSRLYFYNDFGVSTPLYLLGGLQLEQEHRYEEAALFYRRYIRTARQLGQEEHYSEEIRFANARLQALH